MFQFANRLAARGHSVTILYSIRRPYKNSKTPVWLRYMIDTIRGAYPKWFDLDKSIVQKIVPEITNGYVPDANATLCTWWQMAYAINELSPSKGNKCNLIQDYEIWTGQEDKVHQSYSLPVRHCVIAKYLLEIVEKHSGKRPALTPLAIDVKQFVRVRSSDDRDTATVIMLYSEEPRKGSSYGIEALKLVKEKIPDLRVTLFSVYQRPDTIPAWMEFYTRPKNLSELYNNNAIFFSPSLGEGWALPPAEAMSCGCAVVCTDIGGHRDYAIDGQTALLVQPKAVDEMVKQILSLINSPDVRIRMANRAHELITTQFTWEKSVERLESILLGNRL